MTNVLMHDSRRLVLPLETMVDVLIDFDHAHKRWPANATLEAARVDESNGVVLSVKQAGQDVPIDRTYSLAIVAAAIIHYCAKMRVPIPRNAAKSVTVTPGGVAMILEGTLFLQRQHQELPAGFAATPQAARTGSSPQPADAAPGVQPDVDAGAPAAAANGPETGPRTA